MQSPTRAARPPTAARRQVEGSRRFDLTIVLLSGWVTVGTYSDAWAHHNMPGLETFFTPWHGLLYSGFLVLGGTLAATAGRHRAGGYAWRGTLPTGYELAPLGILLFAAGGVGDMFWHTAFGIEVGIEALLSPTHLLLALGFGMLVTAPARAFWRSQPPGAIWRDRVPGLLSLTLTLAVLTFFSEYANAFSQPWAADARPDRGELGQMLGVTAAILQSGLLMGTILLALRRGLLFGGALTLLLTLSTALAVFPHEEFRFLPVGLLAGAAADLLLGWLRSARSRPVALRGFAFAVPAILFAGYFATLALTGTIIWSIHLWSGAILLAGTTGWLLSFLLLPPDPTAPDGAGGW